MADEDTVITLKQLFEMNRKPSGAGTGNRSGKGSMVGAQSPHSTHLQGRLPKPWPRGGQTGSPNQSPTMMASRMMQQTSTDEDIKYWMGDPEDPDDVGATFDPPYTFPRYYSDYMKAGHDAVRKQSGSGIEDPEPIYSNMKESLLRSYLRKFLLEYRDAPVQTSSGMFIFNGTQSLTNMGSNSGNYDIYKNPKTNIIIGVKQAGDGYYAYSFEDGVGEYSDSLEDAIEKASTSLQTESEVIGEEEEEGGSGMKDDGPKDPMDDRDTPMDEISAIGGGAIAGYTGPLGMPGGNPAEKKRKGKKKSYEPSMRAFGGGSEVD